MKEPNALANIDSASVLSETYRNHQLTASFENGVCVGKVFSKGTQVAYCEALGWAHTEQHLRLIVDNDFEKKYQRRGANPISFEELKGALLEIKAYLEPNYINMLRYHYQADMGAVPLVRLTQLGRCNTTTEVYFMYASIARCLCDEMAYMPPAHHSGREPMMSMLISESECQLGVELILQPEIKQALAELQW